MAIFHSIHRVMKAEQVLLDEGLDILLIPVPRQLSADCGMALRFPGDLLDQIRARLMREALPMAEVWQMQNGCFRAVS